MHIYNMYLFKISSHFNDSKNWYKIVTPFKYHDIKINIKF